MEKAITAAQRRLMMHTVGSDISSEEPYRNYYAADESNTAELDKLVDMGLMQRWKKSPPFTEGLKYFSVSESGLELLRAFAR